MTPRKPQNLWDRIWKDRNGNVVIAQFPNVPLLIWLALATASIFVPRGPAQNIMYWTSVIALVIWALLEIFKGVNYFRRLLGMIIFAVTIAGVLSHF